MAIKQRLIEGIDYRVTTPGHYQLLKDYNNGEFIIPSGFRFEPSVPEWLWDWFPIDDHRLIVACLEHDWMHSKSPIKYSFWAQSVRWYKNVRMDGMGWFKSFIMAAFLFIGAILSKIGINF